MLKIIYYLFVLSGFIGLIYESIWSRYLKLLLGHASYGQIVTLAIYMGGLGIGSFVAGKYFKQKRNPLYVYSLVELLIGISGLFYHEIYLVSVDSFYQLISSGGFSPLLIDIIKVSISIIITTPIAILLGMTFPCITMGVMRITRDSGKSSLPVMYFTNSLGAAIGILFTSYYFIHNLGTENTLTIAACGNILISIVFYLIAQKSDEYISLEDPAYFEEQNKTIGSNMASMKNSIIIWLSISFFTGLSSFVYEIGWIRLLSLLLGSSIHSFDIMVSTFILGLAFGGLFAKKLIRSGISVVVGLALSQILMGVFAISSIFLYKPLFLLLNYSHILFEKTELSYKLYSTYKYFLCMLLMFPTCFFAGITLPLITYFLSNSTRDEKYIGSVYGWNTIGAIIGAVIGGLLVLPALQLKNTILFGALIDLIIGLLLMYIYIYKGKESKRILKYSLGFLLLLITAAAIVEFDPKVITSGTYRYSMGNFDTDEEIKIKDGKTATISFHKRKTMMFLRSNGKTEGGINTIEGKREEGDELTQAACAFFPMSTVDKPYNAAMIGMGTGMTAHHLLSDPLLQKLDIIEIEEEVNNLAREFFPYNRRAYEDSRATYYVDDARTFLNSSEKKYDVIVSVPSNLWVSGVSGLFTKEFYSNVNKNLDNNGLLVQWLPLYEFNSDLMITILKAINSVFPYMKIYSIPGRVDILIIMSQSDFQPNKYERFKLSPEITKDFRELNKRPGYFGQLNFIVSSKSLKLLFKHYEANSDFYPHVERGVEKAFFMNDSVDLFEPFIDSLYYQDLLEPEEVQFVLNEITFFKMNAEKREKVIYLLKNGDPDTSWNYVYKLFVELVTEDPRGISEIWDKMEIIKLFKKNISKMVLPLEVQLKFKFLDNLVHNNKEEIQKSIYNIVNNLEEKELSIIMVRALAVNSVKLKRANLYKRVVNKYVLNNARIKESEKKFILYLVELL